MGRAQQTFLSAEPTASVVGATADTLLELDEAQDVDRDKFIKEFRPMGATGNATTVLYGTPWDGGTLLESMAEENRELERQDGVRRDFRFDWEAVAACSPLYRRVRGGGARPAGRGAPAVPDAVPAAADRAGGGDVQSRAAGAASGRALSAAGAADRGGCTSRASTWRGSRGGRASGLMVNGIRAATGRPFDRLRANGIRAAATGPRRREAGTRLW